MNTLEIEQLAKELINQHGLKGWVFGWNKLPSTFGICRYTKKKIELSSILTPLCEDATVIDTIKHEIAHALVGTSHGHNDIWKSKAIEIGCSGDRCGFIPYSISKKLIGTCPVCKYMIARNKRTESSCGKCCKTFDDRYLLIWENNPKAGEVKSLFINKAA